MVYTTLILILIFCVFWAIYLKASPFFMVSDSLKMNFKTFLIPMFQALGLLILPLFAFFSLCICLNKCPEYTPKLVSFWGIVLIIVFTSRVKKAFLPQELACMSIFCMAIPSGAPSPPAQTSSCWKAFKGCFTCCVQGSLDPSDMAEEASAPSPPTETVEMKPWLSRDGSIRELLKIRNFGGKRGRRYFSMEIE